MAHPVYKMQDIEDVKYTHQQPKSIKDRLAYWAVIGTRKTFDIVSGYNPEKMTER